MSHTAVGRRDTPPVRSQTMLDERLLHGPYSQAFLERGYVDQQLPGTAGQQQQHSQQPWSGLPGGMGYGKLPSFLFNSMCGSCRQ